MTKILAINTIRKMTADEQDAVMLEEVQVVAQMYVDGRIEQYWRREDGKGAVLLLATSSLDEAENLVKELPLTREGFLTYELIPLGPLVQLSILIQASTAAGKAEPAAIRRSTRA
jgi:hypothetical protein